MKRLLLVLAMFTACLCDGQNYQCLQEGVKHYFTNSNGYLRGIRIDSVKIYADFTVYYPFHTPRGPYLIPSATGTLDSLGGSWLGKNVIVRNADTFLFDNFWHDTVVIKSQAHIGDTWIFFRDMGTMIYYKASVTSIDTMTILGILDSIKKITITTWDSTTNIISDSLNNTDLILSKNHGFVQVIDLYTFPYVPPEGSVYHSGLDYYLDAPTFEPIFPYFSAANQHVKSNSIFKLLDFRSPSFAQIYGWNIGDVYEYSVCNRVGFYTMDTCNPPDQNIIDSITGMVLTSGNSQYSFNDIYINYTLSGAPPNVVGYSVSTGSSTIVYDSTLLVDTLLMPEELGQQAFYYCLPSDSSFCMNSALYGIASNGLDRATFIYSTEYYPPVYVYKPPLGLLYSNEGFLGGVYFSLNSKSLAYYNRVGSPCGSLTNPVLVSNIKEPNSSISLFPNPAKNEFIVRCPSPISELTITNLVGQTVYHHLPAANCQMMQIDVADLPTGVYFVKVNGSEVRKFVKE